MTELMRATPDQTVVPITYSSRKELNPEGHDLYPSRLSLMAYDAACYVAAGRDVKRLVIAGEQSYSDDDRTTGDLLHHHTHPTLDFDISVLRDTDNRLLNTPHQVDALSDEFGPDQKVVVVCWRFHEKRLRQGFGAKANTPQLEFIAVEDVISDLWNSAALWNGDPQLMAQEFRDRYQIQVGWEDVLSEGIPAFERRERLTRLAMHFGKSGWLLKLLTGLRSSGRYDDIDEFAMPIQQTTH